MKSKFLLLILISTLSLPITANSQTPVFEKDTLTDYNNQSSFPLASLTRNGNYFVFRDLEDSGKVKSLQLIKIDRSTGAEEIVKSTYSAEGQNWFNPHIPIAVLTDYTITRSGPYNRLSILRNADGKILGSVSLADEVVDVHIEDGVVYFLQHKQSHASPSHLKWTVLVSRFRLEDMAYLDETEVPRPLSCSFLPRHIFNGKMPMFEWDSSSRRGNRKSTKLSFLTMKDVGALPKRHKPATYCGAIITSVGRSHFAVRSGPKVYSIIHTGREEAVFTISGKQDADKLNIVFSDDYVFTQPIYNFYHRNKKNTRPISIYDLKNGREIISVDMPTGDMVVIENKLLINITTQLGKKVAVYKINKDVIQAVSKE